MKLCDLTQFYSPLSGGVKRYAHEKIRYIQNSTPDDEHVLIVPGGKTEAVSGVRSRIYSVHSPLVSRTSRYRALLNLRAIEHVLERERPDLIEVGDPYQTAWKAIASGEALRIPVVAFYHSHFPEAYLRGTKRFLGKKASDIVIDFAVRYVRQLYNRFETTLVPSQQLAEVLQSWGVRNVRAVDLGVNSEVFCSELNDRAETRHSLGVDPTRRLLLYVGRLAPEKNVATLFGAFRLLSERRPQRYHLLVIGDGTQRAEMETLQARATVTWQRYCSDSSMLARYFRAADLFVHPGLQETFGLVALESQACGTPVVGIRGSYMDRNILHDQNAWAQEDSASALAGAIEAMSAQDLAAIGGSASRLVASRYAWPRVFDQLFSIYREVIASYRRS